MANAPAVDPALKMNFLRETSLNFKFFIGIKFSNSCF